MKNILHKITTILISGLLFSASVLWLSSYTHHTAVGIDHDFEQQDSILHKYYRINWTGYGSIWVGYGSVNKPNIPERSLEKFDLAAALFHRKYKPLQVSRQTFWNRLGFYYINSTNSKPVFWIGTPSWLPVLLLSLFLFVQMKRGNREL